MFQRFRRRIGSGFLLLFPLLTGVSLVSCGGGSSSGAVSDAQTDACVNYGGVQDSAEIAARGFVSDDKGVCRLARNHAVLAVSGVDVALMAGWTGAGTAIAVIDSGYLVTHEAIAMQVATVAAYHDLNANYLLDANEKTLDDAAPLVAAHGTSVASLAAGQGISPAPGAGLWLKAMGDENPYTRDLAIALKDALENEGLGIINLSLDIFSNGLIYRSAADDETGILPTLTAADRAVIVSAAGNMGDDLSALLDYAQRYKEPPLQTFFDGAGEAGHVLMVGAYDDFTGSLDAFSNFPGHRQNVQARFLVATGVAIESASSGSDSAYRSVSGTSFAAPQVSGAIAVLQEANPQLTPVDAANILLETARRPTELGYGTHCTSTTDLGTFAGDCGAMKFGRGLMDLPAAIERVEALGES